METHSEKAGHVIVEYIQGHFKRLSIPVKPQSGW
jgi:hypothetical protein